LYINFAEDGSENWAETFKQYTKISSYQHKGFLIITRTNARARLTVALLDTT